LFRSLVGNSKNYLSGSIGNLQIHFELFYGGLFGLHNYRLLALLQIVIQKINYYSRQNISGTVMPFSIPGLTYFLNSSKYDRYWDIQVERIQEICNRITFSEVVRVMAYRRVSALEKYSSIKIGPTDLERNHDRAFERLNSIQPGASCCSIINRIYAELNDYCIYVVKSKF
jgi:hypothetical protein